MEKITRGVCLCRRISFSHCMSTYPLNALDEELVSAKPYESIPSIKTYPVLGSAWTFLPIIGMYDPMKIHEASLAKYQKYGSIVRERLFRDETVHLFDPQDIEKLFRQEGKNPVRSDLKCMKAYRQLRKEWFGPGGLVVTHGQEWYDLRSKVQGPLLRPQLIYRYLDSVANVASDMVNRIEYLSQDKREVPNFLDELYKWALESVGAVALDARLGCLDKIPNNESLKLIDSLNTIFQCINQLEFSGHRLWKLYPTPTWKKFVEASDFFAKTASKHMKNANRKLEMKPKDDDNMTLLETFLNTKNMSTIDTLTIITDMLMGGIDTTSHAMGFFLYLLGKNQEAQEKLYLEISSALPSEDSPLTPEVIDSLPYFSACIKESLRLHPVVIGTVRILDHDIVLSGYRIPHGTILFIHNQVIGRLEKYFAEAEKFKPERWLEKKKPFNSFSFLPFGFGPRMCIGKRIAELEIRLLTIKILQRFRVEYNHEDIGCYSRLVNVPDKPLLFQFLKR